MPGHQIKIIEKMAGILDNETINELGNLMRAKRNLDFYGGGIEITEKECREFLKFTEDVFLKIKAVINIV